jgi:diazepam-binding inhibitor (GABA receptor modulating acyl-CoA-binding protein)
MNLENEFLQKSKLIKKSNINISNEIKLNLYKYYKQAVIGDCNVKAPNFLEYEQKMKWTAWNHIKGTDKNKAMNEYISIVNGILIT